MDEIQCGHKSGYLVAFLIDSNVIVDWPARHSDEHWRGCIRCGRNCRIIINELINRRISSAIHDFCIDKWSLKDLSHLFGELDGVHARAPFKIHNGPDEL